jgi:hypothetical protein
MGCTLWRAIVKTDDNAAGAFGSRPRLSIFSGCHASKRSVDKEENCARGIISAISWTITLVVSTSFCDGILYKKDGR